MTEHIVLSGKGGVGTTTLASNVSAALVEAGFRVFLVGCGLKGDSSTTIAGAPGGVTVWDQYQKEGRLTFDGVVNRGFKGIYYIELGSPEDDQSAAATSRALDLLLEYDLLHPLSTDFVIYDVSGDLAAGVIKRLSDKIRLHRLFAVSTADVAALAAVNTLMTHLKHIERDALPIAFGGLLPNAVANSFEESFIVDYAKQTGAHTLGRIPRSQMVRQCELYGKTVIEASPLSNQAYFYRRLANQIVDVSRVLTVKQPPRAMEPEKLRAWLLNWADRLYAIENGLVSDGAAI